MGAGPSPHRASAGLLFSPSLHISVAYEMGAGPSPHRASAGLLFSPSLHTSVAYEKGCRLITAPGPWNAPATCTGEVNRRSYFTNFPRGDDNLCQEQEPLIGNEPSPVSGPPGEPRILSALLVFWQAGHQTALWKFCLQQSAPYSRQYASPYDAETGLQ